MNIHYSELLPPTELNHLVRNFWLFEIPETIHNGRPFEFELMPELNLSMVFVKNPLKNVVTFSGVRNMHMKRMVYPGTMLTGIRFNPWVNIPSLFGNKLHTLNQVVECDEKIQDRYRHIMNTMDSQFDKNVEAIINELHNLEREHPVHCDEFVKYICFNLDGHEKKVSDILKDIPMSIRVIQKHFKQTTALSMIDYRNIGRLRESAKSIFFDQNSISYSALLGGFTDHAHFIHSFQKYMAGTRFKSYYQENKLVALK